MFSIEFLILILIAVVLLIFALWNVLLTMRISRLTRGVHQQSLENILSTNLIQTEMLIKKVDALEAASQIRDTQFKNSVQGFGFVRFNPFEDAGGQQSFACALINHHGDGVIFSTLYAREKMRIFAKKVSDFSPDQELSTEEQKALAQARDSLTSL